ncbi:amidase [Kineococcus sp. T13]|uniref:amidase n=1 Tax=Kineococcus vitellinus TaxID=2696565 RepID=UPI0014126A88|nr:amidase [Kineococcus vitellinus]NAZ74270.1 amidase [Kineococcus vitellinus]
MRQHSTPSTALQPAPRPLRGTGGQAPSRRSLLTGGAGTLAGLATGAVAAVPPAAASTAGAAPHGRTSDVVHLDASALSRAIARRQISCVEVMNAYLDHIEGVNPRFNALVSLRPREELLAEALGKDRLLARGVRQGWMHGLPHAVKDLANVRGLKTTSGFFRPPFDVPPASADALHVERMRNAGAVFIGKTNTPEFGLGSHTYNEVFGATLNAYDRSRSAGGSSGGAAVALATRMLPVADGSDFFGSLRNPAGWNNVLGMRPSFGRVPGAGADVFVQHGGVEGPMARNATDLALLLSTLAGYDERSPLSIEQEPDVFAGRLRRDFRGARVAWLGDLGGYLPTEPGLLPLCEQGLRTFSALGAHVEHLDALPTAPGFAGTEDLWPLWLVFRHWLIGGILHPIYQDPLLRAAMKPEAIYEVEGLLNGADGNPAITGLDTYTASVKRTAMYQAFRQLFQTYEFLVLPTSQIFPFEASTTWPRSIDGVPMPSYHRWMEVTAIATLLGAPAISLPVGFDARGLPAGVQVIARNHADLSLLQLARSWEQVHDWVASAPAAVVQ